MKPDEVVKSEVLVIGGGIAGAAAAIAARKAGADVVLVDKAVVARSGQSTFAAGIYAVCFPERDNLDDWVEEMIDLGEYLNDQEAAGSPIKKHLVKGKATPFVRKVQISYLQANSANQPPTSFPLP